MSRTNNTELDYRPSYLAAALTAALVFVLYLVTLAPSTAMWDTSEYIAAAYVVGLPHPPGNPLFVLIGRVFAILPLGGLSVAVKINILAALTSAIAAGMWFLVAERVLVSWINERWVRIAGGVLATIIGATAFTVWNQSVVNEKVYTVSLMGLAIISWLTVRWCDDPEGPAADRTLVLIAYLLTADGASSVDPPERAGQGSARPRRASSYVAGRDGDHVAGRDGAGGAGAARGGEPGRAGRRPAGLEAPGRAQVGRPHADLAPAIHRRRAANPGGVERQVAAAGVAPLRHRGQLVAARPFPQRQPIVAIG